MVPFSRSLLVQMLLQDYRGKLEMLSVMGAQLGVKHTGIQIQGLLPGATIGRFTHPVWLLHSCQESPRKSFPFPFCQLYAGFSDWLTRYVYTQSWYLSWKLPWVLRSTMHSKIPTSLSPVLWSKSNELMKKRFLEANPYPLSPDDFQAAWFYLFIVNSRVVFVGKCTVQMW